jgi:integrase
MTDKTTKTVRATTATGKPYTGIYWKKWETEQGIAKQQLGISYYAEGKRRWENVPENTVTAAKALRDKRLTSVREGEYLDPARGRVTFGELAEKWFGKQNCRAQSLERYRTILDRQIIPALGKRKLSEISPETVEQFARDLQSTHAVSTSKMVVGQLGRILKAGVRWEYLKANPVDSSVISYTRKPKRESNPLTPVEARQFLSHLEVHCPKWYPFFLMAITTGMRMGELSAAKWEHLDWRDEFYFVRENLTRRRTFDLTKTVESEARVKLSVSLLDALRIQQANVAERTLRAREWPQSDLIFPNARGKPYDHQTLNVKVFQRRLCEAGITRSCRFHDLRHTCASLMISSGASVKGVQLQMRHSSSKITLDTYGHLYADDRTKSVEQLDAVLLG